MEVNMTSVIEVTGLQKTYGSVVAVDDVSFAVNQGEIFGMVGPNGAGKTTTIECIEGLRKPDQGVVRVLGLDPFGSQDEVAERIGVQLQESAIPARLRVGEALSLYGSFYQQQSDSRELLERLGLEAKRSSPFAKLSGGQKQRLFIALALINQPEVVFFDELTTGLDPQARRAMWDLVRRVREQGRTVFLTTHYMEEAERLCDRVLIIDQGKIVALDTPTALIRRLGQGKRLVVTIPDSPGKLPLHDLPQVERVETNGKEVVIYGRGDRFAGPVVTALEHAKIDFQDLRTEQPNLEDVFLTLTGREMRE
jgi:ABC-2 type transport system ATP-binding protein